MKTLTSKVLLLGAQGVGKTCLAARLADQDFVDNITPTIGVSYVETRQEIGDHVVKLQIWDTAGQERFKSMIPMYYRNCSAALLVYDVSNMESFRAAEMWETELRRLGDCERMVIFVIGNKYDMPSSDRKVKQSVADAFAEAIGGHFREVSALSNHGIIEMKVDLSVKLIHESQILKRNKSASRYDELDSILLNEHQTQGSHRCCT